MPQGGSRPEVWEGVLPAQSEMPTWRTALPCRPNPQPEGAQRACCVGLVQKWPPKGYLKLLKASSFQTEQTTDLMSRCPGALRRLGKAGSPRRGPSRGRAGERPAAGVTLRLWARASSYSASMAGVASPAHVQREAPGREQTQRDEKRRWPGRLLPRRREAARALGHGTAKLRGCPLHSLGSGHSEACVSERGGFQRG